MIVQNPLLTNQPRQPTTVRLTESPVGSTSQPDLDFASIVRLLEPQKREDASVQIAGVSASIQAAADRAKVMENVLVQLKSRIAFMGWTAEDMWEVRDDVWVPDWRRECALIEYALHGTPIDYDKLATMVSVPAHSIPQPVEGKLPSAVEVLMG